jgi:DNA-binding IclR family transcriptional regulator
MARAAKPPRAPAGDRQFVTALARGLTVLRCFGNGPRELSPAEIAAMTGLPQPTVWRLCRTLAELGFLTRMKGSDKLRAGLRVLPLGHAALAELPILPALRPALLKLESSFDGAVSVAARDGLDMIFLERLQGSAFVTDQRIGTRVPIARSSLGWAHLAGLPPAAREALIHDIERHDPEAWRRSRTGFSDAFAVYRKQGYVISAGTLHPQINAAAVPLPLPDGEILAISCGGLATHFTPERLKQAGTALAKLAKAAAIQATSDLRGAPPA